MKRLLVLLIALLLLMPAFSLSEGVPVLEFVELYTIRMSYAASEYQSELGDKQFTPGIGSYSAYSFPSAESTVMTVNCSAGLLELNSSDLTINSATFTAVDLNSTDEEALFDMLSCACAISALECDYVSESLMSPGYKYGLSDYKNAVDKYIDVCIEEIWTFIESNADALINQEERLLCYDGEKYRYYTQFYSDMYNETTIDHIYLIAEKKQ